MGQGSDLFGSVCVGALAFAGVSLAAVVALSVGGVLHPRNWIPTLLDPWLGGLRDGPYVPVHSKRARPVRPTPATPSGLLLGLAPSAPAPTTPHVSGAPSTPARVGLVTFDTDTLRAVASGKGQPAATSPLTPAATLSAEAAAIVERVMAPLTPAPVAPILRDAVRPVPAETPGEYTEDVGATGRDFSTQLATVETVAAYLWKLLDLQREAGKVTPMVSTSVPEALFSTPLFHEVMRGLGIEVWRTSLITEQAWRPAGHPGDTLVGSKGRVRVNAKFANGRGATPGAAHQ